MNIDKEELFINIKINIVKEYVKFNHVADYIKIKFYSSQKWAEL